MVLWHYRSFDVSLISETRTHPSMMVYRPLTIIVGGDVPKQSTSPRSRPKGVVGKVTVVTQ